MRYVTRWRMFRAWADLVEGTESVGRLSAKYGYGNEVSFRKAFRKHIGKGPGAVRRESAHRAGARRSAKTQLRYGQSSEPAR